MHVHTTKKLFFLFVRYLFDRPDKHVIANTFLLVKKTACGDHLKIHVITILSYSSGF